MEYLTLAIGLALPWLLGIALLAACGWPNQSGGAGAQITPAEGRVALLVGFGFFVGFMLLTFLMRALSVAGIAFGWASIGGTLAILSAALGIFSFRRNRICVPVLVDSLKALARPQLPRWQRLAWQALLAWLAIRFALLGASVAWQPLYPWDAWMQWATKARVWYELGHITPFVYLDTFLQSPPGAYYDPAPGYPATVPLFQVWSCIALGRWDDAAMNWPWWMLLVALTFAIYGALRGEGTPPLLALVGAYLVASLPLADVHVALAGYADLPMAAIFTLAGLSMFRWSQHRRRGDAILMIFFTLCCPLIKVPGRIWAFTLAPAIVMVLAPRYGWRIVGTGFALAALGLIAVARSAPVIMGYHLHLDFDPAWRSLGETLFLFGNWNFLWYGVIALAALAWRRLLDPAVAPLVALVLTGLGFLFVVFAFTNATAFVADFTTVNRATLHLAPMVIVLCVMLWNALAIDAKVSASNSTSGAASPSPAA